MFPALIAWIPLLIWAVFVVLHALLSGRTWLWALPEMLPPIAFVAVPLLTAVPVAFMPAGIGRLWAAGLSLASLAVGMRWSGVTLPRTARERGETAGEESPIVVFAWNTEYWDQGKDSAAFHRFFRSRRADVYLLQEYVNFDFESHREVPASGIARLRAELPDHEVFVRDRLVTAVHRRLAPRPMPGVPDVALRVDITVGGVTVALFNIHLPEPMDLALNPFGARFYRFVRAKAKQRRQAFATVGALIREAGPPVVVGGDFNSSPAMQAMKRLHRCHVDVMRYAGRRYLATWPAGPRRLCRLWRLDWLFTSPEIATDWAGLVDSGGLSDHEGQLCALRPSSALARVPAETAPPDVMILDTRADI